MIVVTLDDIFGIVAIVVGIVLAVVATWGKGSDSNENP